MNLTNLGVIKTLCNKYDAFPKKSYGQNFLINPAIPVKIAEACADPDGGVIEIGPGIGVLSVQLSSRFRRVAAVEADPALLPLLGETLADFDNISVSHGDILKTDLVKLIDENLAGLEVSVCANLPYYITTPVITSLLSSRLLFKRIVIMVQREIALRLCAKSGTPEYGSITVFTQYHSAVHRLFDVSPGSFYPMPKVTSTVIELIPHPVLPVVSDCDLLFKIIRAAFGQRRKTLRNALSGVSGLPNRDEISEVITSLGHPENERGEMLSPDEFIALTDAFNRFSPQ